MKLHQLIAVVTGRKPLVEKEITNIYQRLGNTAAFNGLNRVYSPYDEEGERLPPENKATTNDAKQMVDEFKTAWHLCLTWWPHRMRLTVRL